MIRLEWEREIFMVLDRTYKAYARRRMQVRGAVGSKGDEGVETGR